MKMNDKLFFRIALGVSVFVFIAVIILNKKILPVPEHIPAFVYQLPALNAILNASCSVLLMYSLYLIKNYRIEAHKRVNLLAFVLSSLFLVSYILYHWMAKETSFPSDNPIRPFYLTILISHIILAAIVLPMVLMSFYLGLQMQVEKHKKLVRFAFPIWLYVTITGVIVYLLISPYYTH